MREMGIKVIFDFGWLYLGVKGFKIGGINICILNLDDILKMVL